MTEFTPLPAQLWRLLLLLGLIAGAAPQRWSHYRQTADID
jgi:hypothetical protein